MSCPSSSPYLCPDLECVKDVSECSPNIPLCPPSQPYKCWNNECRSSFDDCPTKITCPSGYVLCASGMCVKNQDSCVNREKAKLTTCVYRCFDGTCASSAELCPTHVSCGKDEDGNVIQKCWNGACVEDVEECPSPDMESCPSNFPYRCPDGSCREDITSCSSISTCPIELPVKCFDNSCRASLSECPDYQSCGGKVSCPDGTCAKKLELCNTVVTCYSSTPFLCFDHTCKAQLRDCPAPPKCPHSQVLCPNGSCASSRQLCKFFAPCDKSTPIRCASNICTDTISDCIRQLDTDNLKPIGYVSCGDGSYRRTQALCDEFLCPPNKPFKCPEGVCVHEKELCDVGGCPYNRKIKCPEGTCVDDVSKCLNKEEVSKEKICGDENLVLCEDGSCAGSVEECPMKNGCPKEKPQKCADGTCINPKSSLCSPVHCPDLSPIKCQNGYCGKTSSDCPAESREKDVGKCGQGMFMCYDGRCVSSSSYCRPLFLCEAGYVKCADGTCRVSASLCPRLVQCPSERPVRCTSSVNLECVEDENECNSLLCPVGTKLCPTNGECILQSDYIKLCPANGKKANGCPEGLIKCGGGRCLSPSSCALSSLACPEASAPKLCGDGKCVAAEEKCNEEGKCQGLVCPSGRCVSAGEEEFKCTNGGGCPYSKPYRCSDGSCKQSPRQCKRTVSCPENSPFLCSDGSCVSEVSLCRIFLGCENKCQVNSLCVSSSSSCSSFSSFCPVASPVACPAGHCAESIEKCQENVNIPSCAEAEFYCLRLNKCVKTMKECLIFHNSVSSLFGRVLKEEGEEGPEPEGTICSDGSIAIGDEKCPIVPACQVGEYRCPSGACAKNKEKCGESLNCPEGESVCPDGLCHASCSSVAFNGCLVGQFQCSNGMCVESELDCIGFSMCDDPTEPFRCITGKCVSQIEQCEDLERLGKVKNVTYTFNKNDKISITFAFDPKGRISGQIEIPGNSLSFPETYGQIHVEEVSGSGIFNQTLYNNSATFLFNVSNGIIGSEGVLDYENSVMSPVFKIYKEKNNESGNFSVPALLTISHNEYDSDYFKPYDYCLAQLKGYDMVNDKLSDDSHWECVERQSKTEQKQFSFHEYGVYAVLLSPLRYSAIINTDYSFFWENIKWIIIIGLIILVAGAIVYYIFTRIMRYRGKYHENLNKIALLKQQKAEYEQMSTDVFGQTLGDNILGLVYVTNPCYQQEKEKKGSSLEEDIEELQRKCKTVEAQNKRLQEEIDEEKNKYNAIAEEIESEK